MRTFDYIRLADQTWDMDILNLVAKIHEYKGRQDLDDRAAPLLYIMKKFGCDPFVLGIVADFRHTLIKLLYFLAFMLFLLPGKDDSQYVHFEFLEVCANKYTFVWKKSVGK